MFFIKCQVNDGWIKAYKYRCSCRWRWTWYNRKYLCIHVCLCVLQSFRLNLLVSVCLLMSALCHLIRICVCVSVCVFYCYISVCFCLCLSIWIVFRFFLFFLSRDVTVFHIMFLRAFYFLHNYLLLIHYLRCYFFNVTLHHLFFLLHSTHCMVGVYRQNKIFELH